MFFGEGNPFKHSCASRNPDIEKRDEIKYLENYR